jgi:tetratricopeptide (TPR) repeat protein
LAALLYVVVRGEVLHWKFGTESDVLINNPFIKWNGVQWIPFSTAEWSATNMYSLGMYLKILLFPYPLTHDYYPRQFEIMNWSNPHVLLSAVLIVALLTLLFTYRKWNKVILFSIVYFFSTISIVSNFLFPIGTNFSERFVYMPSLGFCAATAFLLSKIPKINIQRFLLLLIIVPYSLLVISRNKDWKNNFSLVEADYPVSSNSAKINNSYAAQLLEIAIKEQSIPERSKLLAQAQLKYSLALKINPTYIEALFGRGSTYFVQGNYSLAVEDYLLAEQIDPNYPSLRTNLVLALREAGKAALKSNDHRTALQYLKAAALRFPNDPEINELVSQISK